MRDRDRLRLPVPRSRPGGARHEFQPALALRDLTALVISPGSPPTLTGSWCAPGGTGSPMVTTSDGHADPIVWNLGADDDNHLHAFDGDSGKAITFPGSKVAIPNMRRYNTPIAAKGRIFVGADNAVVAFKL